jgi:hypothetical protein
VLRSHCWNDLFSQGVCVFTGSQYTYDLLVPKKENLYSLKWHINLCTLTSSTLWEIWWMSKDIVHHKTNPPNTKTYNPKFSKLLYVTSTLKTFHKFQGPPSRTGANRFDIKYSYEYVLSCVRGVHDSQKSFGLDDWISWHLIHTTLNYNTVLSLIPHFTVHCYTHQCPQSSLVISWQWIHNSRTVTATHY